MVSFKIGQDYQDSIKIALFFFLKATCDNLANKVYMFSCPYLELFYNPILQSVINGDEILIIK